MDNSNTAFLNDIIGTLLTTNQIVDDFTIPVGGEIDLAQKKMEDDFYDAITDRPKAGNLYDEVMDICRLIQKDATKKGFIIGAKAVLQIMYTDAGG